MLSELGEGIAAARGCLVENQHLRIGAFTDDPLTHRFLSTFQRRHPKARLSYTELSISTQISGVVDGHVDVSLVWLPSADRRVRVDPLYMEMPVAAVPASHPLARKRRLGIDDLLDEPFALAAEGTPSEWRAHWSLDSRRGGPPKGDVEVTSARESIAAVAYSGAVDTMSANSAGFWSHPGVRFLPIEDAEPTSLALVTASHSSRPLVESFRDIVMEIVRDEIAAAPGAVSLVS
nr:LysR family substrate-binding domain-containing protein [Pseudoclavibacter sp. RFBG4]